MAGKSPEYDPALELTGRMWAAHKEWETRHMKRLPQTALAQLVGRVSRVPVDQTTVGTWFKGTPPKPWHMKALAEIYEVNIMWLAFNEGTMHSRGAEDLSKYAPADEVPAAAYETIEERDRRVAARKQAARKKRA